ncbi:hypothetical protein [Paracoccus sp. NSM]|uniref:hypothetical protein n=1 Tax=Paracoccus sp. NSM TaxID=3457784 RepID=UPI004036D63A
MNQTVLIHIGKCGGSTCRTTLEAGGVRIGSVVHIRQPQPDPAARYVIIARSPIARALSAFNWRHHLVATDPAQAARFPGEQAILTHYGTMDALARQLYFPDGSDNALVQGQFRAIHHLGESIAFYLDPFLWQVGPRQIAGVMMQETLDADLLRLFGIRTGLRQKANRATTPPAMLCLSDIARAHLRRFLAHDFECLDRLRSWGLLSPLSLPALEAETGLARSRPRTSVGDQYQPSS